MKMNYFEESLVREKAQILASDVRQMFCLHQDYNFKDQIMRAVISVSNNIAEGFERRTNNELRNFLFIAKGSCGEVRSMIHLGKRWKYITNEEHSIFYNQCIEISKMLSGRIKTL